MKKMLRLRYFFLATIFALSFHFLSQNVEAALLGVGLGENVYNPQDVNDMGYPWVYNWETEDLIKQNGNKPYKDFGQRYVPMFYNCDPVLREAVKNWITTNNYSGYVLVLNEPDDEGVPYQYCSPSDAAEFFNSLYTWNSNLKYIVGGVRTGNKTWMENFAQEYFDKYNVYPPVSGIHVHIYPSGRDTRIPNTIDEMKMVINAWMTWITLPQFDWVDGKEFWITEYGVLNYPGGGFYSEDVVDEIFQAVTDHIHTKSRINRAAWFTFSHTSPNSAVWGATSLTKPSSSTRNGSKNNMWSVFKSECIGNTIADNKCVKMSVRDNSVNFNLIVDRLGVSCADDRWCMWYRNSKSFNNINFSGDLELISRATTGDYGSCWVYRVHNPQNGASYRLKGSYKSSAPFPTNKAFMQIEVNGNANFLSTPVYLNGTNGSFDRTFTYSTTSDFMNVKFCTWGTNISSDRNVRLIKLALTQESSGGGSATY